MIKLPTVEYMMKIIKKYFGQENNPAFISDLNAEILRINEPAKPEFPDYLEFAEYAAKDEAFDAWYLYSHKPEEYDKEEGIWCLSEGKATNEDLPASLIAWLECINGNRPPQESLICLEEYK